MNIAEKFVEVILRANQGDVEAKLIVGLTKVVVDGIITEDQLQKLVDVYQTQGRQESHALLEQFLSQAGRIMVLEIIHGTMDENITNGQAEAGGENLEYNHAAQSTS